MSIASVVLHKTFGVPEINLNDLFRHNKHVLDPEVDRLKVKAINAIDGAFDHFQKTGAKIVTSQIKDELYLVVGNLHLPDFVSKLVTGVILAYDASPYEGQAITKLGALRDDLVKHVQGAHL